MPFLTSVETTSAPNGNSKVAQVAITSCAKPHQGVGGCVNLTTRAAGQRQDPIQHHVVEPRSQQGGFWNRVGVCGIVDKMGQELADLRA